MNKRKTDRVSMCFFLCVVEGSNEKLGKLWFNKNWNSNIKTLSFHLIHGLVDWWMQRFDKVMSWNQTLQQTVVELPHVWILITAHRSSHAEWEIARNGKSMIANPLFNCLWIAFGGWNIVSFLSAMGKSWKIFFFASNDFRKTLNLKTCSRALGTARF